MDTEEFRQILRQRRRERGLSLRKLQILTSYDYSYLGQIERGEKPGSADVARRCDTALGLDGELIKIYCRSSEPGPQRPGEEDSMRRRTAIKVLATAPLAFASDPDDSLEAETNRVERLAEIYRHLYHSAGDPHDLLGLARDHLDSNRDLLLRLSEGRLKQRVLRNQSEIATLAGRLTCFDLHDPTQARGFYGLAYEAAAQADDDALAAAAAGHLAFVPAREGNPSAALDYLEAATAHASRTGIPSIRSWTQPWSRSSSPP